MLRSAFPSADAPPEARGLAFHVGLGSAQLELRLSTEAPMGVIASPARPARCFSGFTLADLAPEVPLALVEPQRQAMLAWLRAAASPAVRRASGIPPIRTGKLATNTHHLDDGPLRCHHVGLGASMDSHVRYWRASCEFASSFLYDLLADLGQRAATYLLLPPLAAGMLDRWMRRSGMLTMEALQRAFESLRTRVDAPLLAAFQGKVVVICVPSADYDDNYVRHMDTLQRRLRGEHGMSSRRGTRTPMPFLPLPQESNDLPVGPVAMLATLPRHGSPRSRLGRFAAPTLGRAPLRLGSPPCLLAEGPARATWRPLADDWARARTSRPAPRGRLQVHLTRTDSRRWFSPR